MKIHSLAALFALLASAQDARNSFSKNCGVCHGDGSGTERGPNLVGNRKIRAMSNADLRGLIRNGVPARGMPAFPLPAAELDGITALVRGLNAPASEANVPGDKAAGERFFFGKGGCANCHMVFGRGKASGPDLSATGRDMTVAEIEESIANPSAKVRPGYRLATVRLYDGRTVRGFARNHSRYNIQVQDFTGKFHLIDASEAAEIKIGQGSPMPAAKCGAEECRDVVAYLSSLTGVSATRRAEPLASETGPKFEAIANPKPGDWPSYHGNIGGNRHSPLDQINVSNIKDLALQWVFPINHFVVQSTPVVVDGVMYVTGPNQVFAIDGRAGRTIWHYQRPRSGEIRGDPARGTNRGAAILGDRVFLVTDNAHLLALHRVTGQLLWETDIVEGLDHNNTGNTAAPIVVNDMVVAGVSGGDLGMRGFLSAFKASTGERVWRFFTVPKPGEPLAETSWKGSALAKFGGGGGTWMTGTFDPETQTIFWGVGNPYPAYDGDERKGDNLYSACVLALKPETGELKWHYQFTPHDLYDWDGGQTPLVLDRKFRGEDRKLLLNANRNGFFYVLDRTNGKVLLGEKFVDRVTWASGIGKDGRPILIPGMEPTASGTKVCPNVLGAANWPSVAVSPQTGLFYVVSREACGVYRKSGGWNPKPIPLEPGQMFLRALDIETGRRVWEVPMIGSADSWGGVLSTGGGILFFGEDSGAFGAVDARDGRDLWHVQTNASAELGDGHSWRASPMTYMAGGKQYIAVANGPNILAFALK